MVEVLGKAQGTGVLLEENTVDMRTGHVLCAAFTSSLLWWEQNAGRGVVGDETRQGGWMP